MSQQHPAPLQGLAPHLTIGESRGQEAIAFYAKAFDAMQVDFALHDDGRRVMHAQLHINGASLFLNDAFPEYTGSDPGVPEGVTLHLEVDEPDRWWERAVAAGAIVRMPLDDQFWGTRYGQLVDPFGHTWSIGGPLKG